MPVKPIPDGFHTVTPFIVVDGAAGLLVFLKQAFGAEELSCMSSPDGKIQHAEVKIGDSIVMMSDAQGPWKPMPTMLYLYVNDADATYRRALQAGATSLQEPADQFYGDRNAGVKDRCDNVWYVATHIEDVTPDEMRKRAEARGRAQK
jgi:uncharacterized glyoxalase superfamily protein PhnB